MQDFAADRSLRLPPGAEAYLHDGRLLTLEDWCGSAKRGLLPISLWRTVEEGVPVLPVNLGTPLMA